jgi:4-hydroxy-tetrahydrodipicolinate synthase
MSKQLRGIFTAVVTPFAADGSLSPAGLRRQVDRQVGEGNGVFCAGTNGEFFALETAEKIAVAEICVDRVAGRVPVLAHVGEVSPAATIALAKAVAKAGVDAVSVITPWFVPLKQAELVDHFRRVADASPVPVFLYNIPARTGNRIAPETAATLAAHGNIAGLKDSAGDWDSLSAYLAATRDIAGFDVLCGPDHLGHDGLVAGCAGCISGLANVAPQWVSKIWTRFRDGDVAGSKAAQDVVSQLRKELYAVGFAPAAVKKAVALLGEEVGDSRYAVRFSDAEAATIRDILERLSLVPQPVAAA